MPKHDDVTPEKFDLRSLDVAAEERARLLELFPACRTEGGKIDFERLKGLLGEQIDGGKERYGLTWPGKAACFQTIQRPSLATLRPKPEESVEFDTTQNVIIEGDNLEVLKLLQKSYLGKVKMIYIDPPYNTGNDFIYPDNFAESLQTYLEYTGQVDGEGRRFSTNTEADGRFHSKWLSMMYPRLYLARNLLREDGVIYVSIDDHEVANLRHLMDEVLGEENFVEGYVWESNFRPDNSSSIERENAQHVLCYARNRSRLRQMVGAQKATEGLPSLTKSSMKPSTLRFNPDWVEFQIADGQYTAGEKDSGYRLEDSIRIKDGRATTPFALTGRVIWSQSYLEEQVAVGTRIVIKGDSFVPYSRKVTTSELAPTTLIPNNQAGDVLAGNAEVKGLFGEVLFTHPKPSSLVSYLCRAVTIPTEDSIILDFFAGSGTTAHAVLEQNKKDGGNRKFVLVQLPEPTRTQKEDGTWVESAAWKAGFPTIADITKERVRRVIKNLNDADKDQLRSDNEPKPDRGFRVFQLAPSNFKPWNGDLAKDGKGLQQQLFDHVEHVLEGRSEQDLLYEILLKDGFELTTPVETIDVHGFRVHSIAGGELLLCLQDKLTRELIHDLAERRPSRVVFLDRGFRDNDQLKANAAKLFASKAGENFKKFKTV